MCNDGGPLGTSPVSLTAAVSRLGPAKGQSLCTQSHALREGHPDLVRAARELTFRPNPRVFTHPLLMVLQGCLER